MTDNADCESPLGDAMRRVQAFSEDMQDQGIHVGIGVNGREASCANCGQPWPCPSVQTGRTEAP